MSTELIDQDVLNVDVIAPPLPLTLVDGEFLSSLKLVEKQIAELKVVDQASAQLAASLTSRLTTAGTKLEKARVDLKAPFLAIERKIDATAALPRERIEAAKKTLKMALVKYDEALQEAARKAEQARQAELARLEKIRQAEEAEAKKKADELAAQAAKAAAAQAAKETVDDFDFTDDAPPAPPPKTETEKQIEAVKFAPAPIVSKPIGIRYKTKLIFEIQNPHALPSAFQIVTADETKIRQTYCVGWKETDPIPELPGVKFTTSREVDSTGRGRAI